MGDSRVPVKIQRPNCAHSSGVMWLPPPLTPPPCSLDSSLWPRLGGLTEFPPASEALSMLFPLLRAPSCQTPTSTGPCFLPFQVCLPWAAGPTGRVPVTSSQAHHTDR